MGELDRIAQIGPGPHLTPRVGDGERRQRQPHDDQHERKLDLVELFNPQEEVETPALAPEEPVEEPYRLDIAV